MVNNESLCRSTQWVFSLNTALSPSYCVVIQEEECNHTLGSLTPLNLLTHPLRCPNVAVVRIFGSLWPGSQVRERLIRDRISHHAHIVWVHFGKPAGFTIVETNPGRRLSWTRSAMR